MLDEQKRFLTIRQVANTGILSEGAIRRLHKDGKIPGIYSGTRFLVNYPLLIEQLNKISMSDKGAEHNGGNRDNP